MDRLKTRLEEAYADVPAHRADSAVNDIVIAI